MCGIAGFCDFSKKSNKQTLINMTDVLHHRGPDDSGYSFHETVLANIGLGHRRLSILDLSTHGHQPMSFENFELVFNGEIYNFKEMKIELEKYGYRFNSNSDTEIILKAYHKWGIESVHKFNGMFSIALYDKVENKIFFIRDRAGKKPLYYLHDNNGLIFASELKSIMKYLDTKPNIDTDSLTKYLQFGYIGGSSTIYKNIYKLQKSSYLIFDVEKNSMHINNYETTVEDKVDFNNYQETKESLHNILLDATKQRMISDVPIGSFLSGGIDSSLITSFMSSLSPNKIDTFTIGFNNKEFNEAEFAKETAKHLGTNHHELYLDEKDLLDNIETIIENMDEPFADQSILPTYLLSKFTVNYVTVALSGDGADELFCGYNHYFYMNKLKNIYKIPKSTRKLIFKPLEIVGKNRYTKIYKGLTCSNLSDFHHHAMSYWKDDDICSLLNLETEAKNYYSSGCISETLEQAMLFDENNFLTDGVMVKVDRASMLASLETRAPFLDYRVVAFAHKTPLKYKVKNQSGKLIIKDILEEYLPKNIWDRKKSGFSIPLKKWLSGELKIDVLRVMSKEYIIKQEIFNFEIVHNILLEHYSGKYFRTSEIWNLYIFQKWWEKHYEK